MPSFAGQIDEESRIDRMETIGAGVCFIAIYVSHAHEMPADIGGRSEEAVVDVMTIAAPQSCAEPIPRGSQGNLYPTVPGLYATNAFKHGFYLNTAIAFILRPQSFDCILKGAGQKWLFQKRDVAIGRER
jgi:hypothetical protein